jgi:hypothetical protein
MEREDGERQCRQCEGTMQVAVVVQERQRNRRAELHSHGLAQQTAENVGSEAGHGLRQHPVVDVRHARRDARHDARVTPHHQHGQDQAVAPADQVDVSAGREWLANRLRQRPVAHGLQHDGAIALRPQAAGDGEIEQEQGGDRDHGDCDGDRNVAHHVRFPPGPRFCAQQPAIAETAAHARIIGWPRREVHPLAGGTGKC